MELARQGIKFMELLEEYAGIMEGYTKIVFGSQDGDGGADCRKTGKAKQEET